jgi:sporulation protein YlmC with PRC-barrel domain
MAYEYDDMKMASVPIDADPVRVEGGDWDDEEREERRVVAARTLQSESVRNSAGEDLGRVEELMIDIPTGRVAYAVLSFGGFLGIGSKLFAVPWQALTFDQRENQFILNVDRKLLENAPGFDKDNWPDMADRTFCANIYSYYGYSPYWE